MTCPPRLLFLTDGAELNWPFRIAASSGDAFPESPFFFTSFASASLYYALMSLFISGVFLTRLISYVFSTLYLETTTQPFTVLSMTVFPIVILITILLKFL